MLSWATQTTAPASMHHTFVTASQAVDLIVRLYDCTYRHIQSHVPSDALGHSEISSNMSRAMPPSPRNHSIDLNGFLCFRLGGFPCF